MIRTTVLATLSLAFLAAPALAQQQATMGASVRIVRELSAAVGVAFVAEGATAEAAPQPGAVACVAAARNAASTARASLTVHAGPAGQAPPTVQLRACGPASTTPPGVAGAERGMRALIAALPRARGGTASGTLTYLVARL
ncbi:MAG TPA: hypothetical protein VMK65_03595 [Longimicrobiales bacterium]|nr:hypothetical protein [Longimicrobiales bacterium]